MRFGVEGFSRPRFFVVDRSSPPCASTRQSSKVDDRPLWTTTNKPSTVFIQKTPEHTYPVSILPIDPCRPPY